MQNNADTEQLHKGKTMAHNYYSAVSTKCGKYKGYIYKYDASGNREVAVWQSETEFETEAQAEDAACEYAEDNDINVELDW